MEAIFQLTPFLRSLPNHSGVYKIYGKNKEILYIGKAKDLRKRINSYFDPGIVDKKIKTIVNKVAFIDIVVTASEHEALLLEYSLIKRHNPRYNIVFKDDKSYPYLHLSNHQFPRLSVFYGKPSRKLGKFFGPFTSLFSIRKVLTILQKYCLIRSCKNSYFDNRLQPCIEYHVKRCSAPCVNMISDKSYKAQVNLLTKLMKGNLNFVIEKILKKMQEAAQREKFELAIQYRNQLILLNKLKTQPYLITNFSRKKLHAIGILKESQTCCITLLIIDEDRLIENKGWILNQNTEVLQVVLEAFLLHYYLSISNDIYPKEVILPRNIELSTIFLKSIGKESCEEIKWISTTTSHNAKWQELALINAKQTLHMHINSPQKILERTEALEKWLNIKIRRMECFDVSHHRGDAAVASCVVFGRHSKLKHLYRHYNIKNIQPGDDYAAIEQVVERRIKLGNEMNDLADVIIIDGGRGQIKKAEKILLKYNKQHDITLLSLSKGSKRISGKENIFKGFDSNVYQLEESDEAFLLLRQIRDVAHKFAIQAQRNKLSKEKSRSIIESVKGVGEKRKQKILNHFGGWQELSSASIKDIANVKGIGEDIARNVWNKLN